VHAREKEHSTVTGYQYIARILKSEGVEWLACFPQTPLIEAAVAEGIRVTMFRHERGALMAADGYSRMSSRTSSRRRFGVATVQAQAGAENSLAGVAQAAADNVPMLFLPDGNARAALQVRPNFSALGAFAGLAKHAEQTLVAGEIGAVMRRAFNALRNGPPGPVVVETLTDVCREEVPEFAQAYRPPQVALQQPAAHDIDAAAQLLRSASRPAIWAGGGVLAGSATGALTELVELLAAPVFCTMPGKSALPEDHPLFLGAGSGTTTRAVGTWLAQCDVLLAVGTSLTHSPYGQRVPAGAKLIHNTLSAEALNRHERADVGLLGDVALTLQALSASLRDTPASAATRTSRTAEVAALRDEWQAQWEPVLASDEEPLSYYRVVRALNESLDRDRSIVTHDAGAPRDCMVPFYQASTPHSYVGWGKTTHLGFGLPLAIGAKIAHPERFCLNIMGDHAFAMSGFDLETAARSDAAITTVVLNNGGMSTYTGGAHGFIGPLSREFGISNSFGNYAQIAEGMGATGIRVRTSAELHAALAEAQRLNADGKTALIEVAVRIEELRSNAGSEFAP
jgi:acetolactate synthase-1/2/3 large subunit